MHIAKLSHSIGRVVLFIIAMACAGAAVAAQEATVLNPTGNPPAIQPRAVTDDSPGPDGVTIYLVSNNFDNADRFLHSMQAWLAVHAPGVKTVYREKKGNYAADDPDLWNEIKANKGLVIMAIGHCSSSTPAVVGLVADLEADYRIPSVGVIVDSLAELARDRAMEEGMPYVRLAFTHTPVAGKTRKESRGHIAGDDPITGKPFMPEVIDYLTKPLTDQEKNTGVTQ